MIFGNELVFASIDNLFSEIKARVTTLNQCNRIVAKFRQKPALLIYINPAQKYVANNKPLLLVTNYLFLELCGTQKSQWICSCTY
jgi:hypothetical protein